MNRRQMLQGVIGASAGLILPPTLGENAEAARRYWALDRTMVASGWQEYGQYDAAMRDWGNVYVVMNGRVVLHWEPIYRAYTYEGGRVRP